MIYLRPTIWKKLHNQQRLLTTLGALLLPAACATQPPPTGSTTPGDIAPIHTPTNVDHDPNPLLAQAEALLAQRQLLPAASILRDIDGSKLDNQDQGHLLLLETELLYLQGDSRQALLQLQQQAALSSTLSLDGRWLLAQRELLLVQAVEGPASAAQLAAELLDRFTNEPYRAELIAACWKNLHRLSLPELEQQLNLSLSDSWSGWLELALIAAQTLDSPDVQVAELALWQQRHPQHTLANALPGGLDLLAEASATSQIRLALVLPLSEPLADQGQAILDGFLAARFAASEHAWPAQQLLVIDSTAYPNTEAAYNAAAAAGAELIIGPFAPQALRNWAMTTELPVPVLTLNWIDGIHTALPPQLALTDTDEATQIARLAFEAGARHALLIRPAGAWGDAMADARLQQWSALEGTVQAVATYSGQSDYSSSLKGALNLALSEQRANRVRQIMETSVEFSPRRRKDLDVIFLLANQPADARSIKPLIAFHYAGNLPVYASSHIYSGAPDPQRDADLNGIRLVETPWSLGGAIAAGTATDPSLGRLQALGADAFLLHWRLLQLEQGTRPLVRGYSGILSTGSDNRIHRELTPVIIRDGVLEAL